MANSTERIDPLLATLALVEEASNRMLNQFIAAPIAAASEFLLDLFCQIRRQRYVHDGLLFSFYAFAAIVLLLWRVTGWPFDTVMLGAFLCYLPLVSVVTRWSRVIWMYVDRHFDPDM